MTDREATIKNLEYHKVNFITGKIVELPITLVDNAITLLKAQEPHVMTFDEIPRQNDSVIILETHRWSDGDYCATAKVKHSDIYNGITMFIDGYGWEVVCENDRYGVDWRCWTAYPSDEIRKETKWDNLSGRSNIAKGS